MLALLAGVAAYTVPLTLLVALTAHLSRPALLARAVRAHRVLPAAHLVAAAVIGAEGLLTVGVLAGLGLNDHTRLLTTALTGCALLFILYAGYSLLVLARGEAGPCGCAGSELPMNGWVPTRAGLLAVLALLAAVGAETVLRPGPTGAIRPVSADVTLTDVLGPAMPAGAALAVILIAAGTLTTLLWRLPEAMHDPSRRGDTG